MTKKKVAAEVAHDPGAVRLGPGAYRGGCSCGWAGEVHEGVGRWAKRAAEADADVHAGRVPEVTGTTPNRPMRIPDPLWAAVVGVAEAEGLTASEISRQALAADPRIAARLEQVGA